MEPEEILSLAMNLLAILYQRGAPGRKRFVFLDGAAQSPKSAGNGCRTSQRKGLALIVACSSGGLLLNGRGLETRGL
jgi:hypothetical protein